MTPADRKRLQRRRDKAAGWAEVNVRVAAEHADAVKAFAGSLPPPSPPTDPRQMSLLDEIDRQLAGGSAKDPDQGSFGL